jgi:hypothetical protein
MVKMHVLMVFTVNSSTHGTNIITHWIQSTNTWTCSPLLSAKSQIRAGKQSRLLSNQHPVSSPNTQQPIALVDDEFAIIPGCSNLVTKQDHKTTPKLIYMKKQQKFDI